MQLENELIISLKSKWPQMNLTYFLYGLLLDAVTSLDLTAPWFDNDASCFRHSSVGYLTTVSIEITNCQIIRLINWKAFGKLARGNCGLIEVLSQHLPGGTEEKDKEPWLG
jgi:hypothetical protein